MSIRTLSIVLPFVLLASSVALAEDKTFSDEQSRKVKKLEAAIDKGDVDAVKSLLTKDTINELVLDGMTPLMRAIHRGQTSLVPVMLEAGASASAPGNYGTTPLHYAAWRGDVEAAKLLLEQGANVKAKDSGSETAL